MNSFIRAINREQNEQVPMWLMRQAGRYLGEYKAVRKEAGSFLKLCYNPDLAAKVTLQPIERFGFDAAILFADILVIPNALGVDVQFIEGDGPKLELLSSNEDELGRELDGLQSNVDGLTNRLEPICKTVSNVKSQLLAGSSESEDGELNRPVVVGFCGAPWTVGLYMLDNKPSKNCDRAKIVAYGQPKNFVRLMDILVEASVKYLDEQIKAGADVVQVFDSWAGQVSDDLYEVAVKNPLLAICKKLKALHPDTPIILFPRGLDSKKLKDLADNYNGLFECLGLDYTVDMQWAVDNLQDNVCIQGNLDPCIMLTSPENIKIQTEKLLDIATKKPGYIFNFGHGILPNTPIENVEALVKTVREYRV